MSSAGGAPEFYVGIDSGGTGTRARVWIPSQDMEMDFAAGPSNFCSAEAEEVCGNLSRLFEQIGRETGGYGQCRGIGIGAAGAGSPSVPVLFRECLQVLGLGKVPVRIVTDAEAALCGALGEAAGIVLISGTGSVCFGRDRCGRRHQAGGEGHLLGDEGSGYAIGREILRAVLREMDGRGEKTALTALVEERAGLHSRTEILDHIYGAGNGKKRTAAFAPLLTEALRLKDPAAEAVRDRAVHALKELAVCVITELGLQQEKAAFGGSILRYLDPVSGPVRAGLTERFPGLSIVQDPWDALDGALLLAQMQKR